MSYFSCPLHRGRSHGKKNVAHTPHATVICRPNHEENDGIVGSDGDAGRIRRKRLERLRRAGRLSRLERRTDRRWGGEEGAERMRQGPRRTRIPTTRRGTVYITHREFFLPAQITGTPESRPQRPPYVILHVLGSRNSPRVFLVLECKRM